MNNNINFSMLITESLVKMGHFYDILIGFSILFEMAASMHCMHYSQNLFSRSFVHPRRMKEWTHFLHGVKVLYSLGNEPSLRQLIIYGLN